jgi:hypothetical protein
VKPVVFQRNYQKNLGIYIQKIHIPIKLLREQAGLQPTCFHCATQNPSNYDLVTLLIGVNNQYQNKPFFFMKRIP